MIENLPSQYQNKPNISALCQVILDKLDEVITSAEALDYISLLENSTGIYLAQWESLVGAPTDLDMPDEERRVWVLAYGIANSSNSRPSDCRDLLNLLGLGWIANWFAGGSVVLQGPAPSFPDPEILAQILAKALSVGIGVKLVVEQGEFLLDQSLRDLFLRAWVISAGVSASKSEGVLRIEGTSGPTVLGSFQAETGAEFVISGQYRGSAALSIVDDDGVIDTFPQSSIWADFEVTWEAGNGPGFSPSTGETTNFVEIRNIKIQVLDPAGVRVRFDRNLRLRWLGDPDLSLYDYNGLGTDSGIFADSVMFGGLAAHVIESSKL